MLNFNQKERYRRQLELPGMGEVAQLKLSSAHVLVLGLGSSGSLAAQLLAGAGCGTIGLLDHEKIDRSDIHRQVLASSTEIGKLRVEAATKRLHKVNPDCTIRLHAKQLDPHNAEQLFRPYHVVIDGLSNWQQKELASDTCMHLNLPMIHGGVIGFRFQTFTMVPGKSACLRCVFHEIGMEDVSRQGELSGIHGPAVGMAGALQASEAIQLIAQLGITGCDELIQFDCLRREFHTVRELGPRPDCPDCGGRS